MNLNKRCENLNCSILQLNCYKLGTISSVIWPHRLEDYNVVILKLCFKKIVNIEIL